MIRIKVDGAEAVQRMIAAAGKQARYAAAVALTKTAQKVQAKLKDDMGRAFDNPSPWIARGAYIKSADPATLTAEVGIAARQTLYVKESFYSGSRNQKPYEKMLAGMGVLPAGYKTVPGKGLKLDARGIPNRTQLKELIGSVGSKMAVYRKQGRGKKASIEATGYFAILPGTRGRLAPGVWYRANRKLQPMLIFVRRADYKRVVQFEESAKKVADENFTNLFNAEFVAAMRSAR